MVCFEGETYILLAPNIIKATFYIHNHTPVD